MDRRIEIKTGISGIGQSGIGFIVIPDDNSRKQYIENCYRTSTVTINGGYGYGYLDNVKIFPDVLQKIHFPISSKEKGTPVFWVRENFSNSAIIVGTLRKEGETNFLSENQQQIFQQVGDNIVEIYQDANSSTLIMNVIGTDSTPANINIKAVSENNSSVINFETDGSLNVSANNVNINTQKGFSLKLNNELNENILSISGDENELSIKDKNKNELTFNSEEVKLNVNKKFDINSGKEPMVLGNTLVDILKELLTSIQKLTVISPVGSTTVPVNAQDFVKIQSKLDSIKSKISNLE